MHESIRAFVEGRVKALDLAHRATLEVGSADVNGGIRALFDTIVGADIVAARGVDYVVNAGEPLPFPDGTFEVVVSTEMLEHDLRPWRTLAEMRRVAFDGAVLLLTCRGFDDSGSFPFHNPPDRWRFSSEALRVLLEDAGWGVISLERDSQVHGWLVEGVADV